MLIRTGTEADFCGYVGGRRFPRAWCTTRPAGLVAEEDGEIVAVAMLTVDEEDRCWIWFDQKTPLSAVQLHRHALALLEAVGRQGRKVHAFRHPREPSAEAWLRRLGFAPAGTATHPTGEERPVWVRG